jgi:hypothetical protein
MIFRKNYTAPFWNMLVLTVLVAIFYILSIRDVSKGSNDRLLNTYIITGAIFFILMLAETIIYWSFRQKPMRKLWVWLHIASLYLAFVGIPLAIVILFLSIPPQTVEEKLWELAILIKRIQKWGTIGLVSISLVFFVLVVIDTNRRAKRERAAVTDVFESI